MPVFFSSLARELGPWSPSKMGVLESCGQKFVWQYVDKPYIPAELQVVEDNTALILGSATHKYAELLQSKQDKTSAQVDAFTEVPKTRTNKIKIKSLVRKVDSFEERLSSFKVKNNVILDSSELRLGVLPDLLKTDFWDRNSILRGVVDRVIIVEKNGSKHAIAIDLKTGRCKSIDTYKIQLESYGILIHAWYDIVSVQPAIYSTTSGELEWYPKKITKADLTPDNPVMLQVNALAETLRDKVAKSKGRHCSWCKFKNICEKEN